jgi:hypothetical protein
LARRTINWGQALSALDAIWIQDTIEEENLWMQRFAEYEKHGSPILTDEAGKPVLLQAGVELLNSEKRTHWRLEEAVKSIRASLVNRFEKKIVDHAIDYIIPFSSQADVARTMAEDEEFTGNVHLYLEEAFNRFYRIQEHEFYIDKNLPLLTRYDEWTLSSLDLDLFLNSLRQGKLHRFTGANGEPARDSNLIKEVLMRGVEQKINNYRHWYIWSRVIVPSRKKERPVLSA